ncbi:MAG: histone H1 [Phycisphaerales bacterium]
MQAYEQLKQLVAAAEEDIRKAEGGNKAAGTRARKSMQDIKAAAQAVRVGLLEARGDDTPGSPGSPGSAPQM